MYKRNIINFLAIFLFCLYSAQAKGEYHVISYNGKPLPTVTWQKTDNNLNSYSFLKLENIISVDEHHTTFMYDTYRKEIDPTVKVSQKVKISVYETLQTLY